MRAMTHDGEDGGRGLGGPRRWQRLARLACCAVILARRGFAPALLAVLLAASGGGGLEACDPDHSWSEAAKLERRMLAPQAVEALVSTLTQRLERPLTSTDRIAVLSVDDETDRTTGVPDAAAALLPLLERAFASQTGATLVGPQAVARELAASGRPASDIYDPAFMRHLGRRLGTGLYLKLRLEAYGTDLRTLKDLNPKNPGLWASHLLARVRVKAALQEESGEYRVIDQFEGAAIDSYVYVRSGDQLTAVAEIRQERPGREPLHWLAETGREHFER